MKITYTSYTTVNNNNTASAMGSGDMAVFATPSMCALMENAAMNAAALYMKESGSYTSEDSTVGISLDIEHIKASPIGKEIKATATLKEIDGRRLIFEITADECDGEAIIGKGTHQRFIVNKEKFLGKLK